MLLKFFCQIALNNYFVNCLKCYIKKDELIMKLFLIALTFLLSSLNIFCSDLKQIASIDVADSIIFSKYKYNTIEIALSNKQSLGRYRSFKISDIIEGYIKNIPHGERKNLLIIAENAAGETTEATYHEFDDRIVRLQPIIVYNKVTNILGDTIEVYDVEGIKGKVDLDMVEEEVSALAAERFYLQFSDLPEARRRDYLTKGGLIFLQDQSYSRWLDGVIRLKIYKFTL